MKFKYLFILYLMIISCKSKDNALMEVDIKNQAKSEIKLSEIADDIKYIPLENCYPLGLIYDNIEFVNNSIYLSAKDAGILVFDKSGKIIRNIGNKGRGPGEYLYNYEFTVDPKTETIYVCDLDKIKIFSKSGKFLRSISLKEYGDFARTIKFINSKLFVFYSIQFENSEYKWIIFDSLGNLIKKEKRKAPKFKCNFTTGEGAYIFNKNITYWNSFNDTVFSIFPDLTEKASFLISPRELRFPISKKNISIEELTQYLLIAQILETDNFLMIRYSIKGENDFLVFEKENGLSHKVNWEFNGESGILNDLDGGLGFVPIIYFKDNGREFIAGILNSIQLKNLVSSNDFINSNPIFITKKKELENLANSMKETDNPVLITVRLIK